ncbi:MAG TPA: hypothetical protein VE269_01465 [Gaiellaceae bacterium]|nr:hypothetical protein [Gaiellaceae bacterium]
MTARAALALAAAVLACTAAGCGGSSADARRELQQTLQRLGSIQSGDLTLRLIVTPSSGARGRVGFAITGPFALRPRGLPLLDVRYTQTTGTHQATARLVSDGNHAVAFVGGRRVALPAGALRQLSAGGHGTGGIVAPLGIDSWLTNPSRSSGGMVGGAETDRISGKLEVVDAANGLMRMLRQLGRAAPAITDRSAEQLRKAVRSSSVDVWTGTRDRLLRRLRVEAQLAFDVPAELKRAFGEIVGADVEFELGIANPNTPVHVTVPGA